MQQQQQPSITAPQASQAPQAPQASSPPLERELPMLAGIAGFMRWVEELLNILNGPMLMVGAGIALVDLLTDGAFSADIPSLLFAWAISQALGIDLQLIGCFARARMALRRGHFWALVGWIFLGLLLGFATWQAGFVYAVQQSQHITTLQAMTQMHMDHTTWLAMRVALAVGLVALAGWTRYIAPHINAAAEAQSEREQLERDIANEPLRAQRRAMQLRGMRAAVMAGLGREQPTQTQTMKPHIVAASSTLPLETPPQEHHAEAYTTRAQAMHDWDDIPDEVEGDEDPNETTFIPSVSRPRDPRMGSMYDDSPLRNDSPLGGSYGGSDFDPFDESEEDDDFPFHSAHQRKKNKTAKGRSNQRQVKAGIAVKTQSDRERQRAIRQAVWSVADRIEASGSAFPSEDKLVIAVNNHLKAQGSEVRTSRTAVRSWLKGWNNQRRHQQRQTEIEPMEPQEIRELQEAW
jgi:hypothetical protein